MRSRSSIVVACLSCFVVACGPPGRATRDAAEAPQHEPFVCKDDDADAKPYVVEWQPASRAELERALKSGLVVAKRNGCDIRVLTTCVLNGSYAYVSTSAMRDRVNIKDREQLAASLPVGAASLAGTFARGGQLAIDSVVVGTLQADRHAFFRDELAGPCEGATHVVHDVTLGAFHLESTANAAAGAKASFGGAGASGSSESEKNLLTSSGNLEACNQSTDQSLHAPANCGATIRIALVPLGTRPPKPKTCQEGMAFLPQRVTKGGRLTADVISKLRIDCRKDPDVCEWKERITPELCIDKNEVTAAEYADCVKSGKCNADHVACAPEANYGVPERAKHPMNCVDFYQADAYCRARNKRLPSPDEFGWAQGSGQYFKGTRLLGPWGDRYPDPTEVWASIGDQKLVGTAPIGTTPKSDTLQGVRDLWGNVSEWSDRYSGKDGGVYAATMGPNYTTTKEVPMTAGAYFPQKPGVRGPFLGFRCAGAPE